MFKVLWLQALKFFRDELFGSSGGQPDGKGGDRFAGKTLRFLASLRAANERRCLKLKAFVVHFKRLDLGPPTAGCPNQIVLPAHVFWDIPNLLCDLPCAG